MTPLHLIATTPGRPSSLSVFTARRDVARHESALDEATDDLAAALSVGGLVLLRARARFARADRELEAALRRLGRAKAEQAGERWLRICGGQDG